jgi:ABC-type antimicrobial peptide transport system permease subunit
VAAVSLTVVGMYGLLSQSVATRTPEIGIRMALGATAAMMARLVAWRAAMLATSGALVGTAVATWSLGFLSGFVLGVSPRDPITLAAAAATAWLTAMGAALVPARRAARLAPLAAIRSEE